MSPDAVDPMVMPSAASLVAFLAIVLGVVAAVVVAVRWTGRARGDAPAAVARDVRWASIGLVVYLAATAAFAASGLARRGGTPPPVMLLLGGSNLIALGLALSPLGARVARHLPIAAIIGFQAFRLPLELVLHRWYLEGTLPVTMTYAGSNYDIASGALAIVVALWAWRGQIPRWVVGLYTVVGLGLLLRVIALAVLSSPLPFRQYFEGPPVQLAAYVPTVWIVPICVGGALAGHVIALRWLVAQRR